jgi:hypothetical protein
MTLDSERFVTAGTAEDPLTAEAYTDALKAEGIAVLLDEARAGSVEALTIPTSDWWEVKVPEHQLERARAILAAETERLQKSQEEASKAAEEEALGSAPAE